MHTAEFTASVMASAAKRVRVGETSSEQPPEPDYEGDSDAQGMSSGEESELDRLLDDEEENVSDQEFVLHLDTSEGEEDESGSDDEAGVAGTPVPPCAVRGPGPRQASTSAAPRPLGAAEFYSAAPSRPLSRAQPGPLVPAVARGHRTRSRARAGGRGHGGARGRRQGQGVAEPSDQYQSYDDIDRGNQMPPFTPTRPSGVHFGQVILRGTMKKAVEFFHLFFTFEMINNIVNHTNSYAYEHIMEGTHRTYAQPDGSWKEVTSDEIKRLIALLIYFGLVRVGTSVDRYWSIKSLYHGLWARSILGRGRYRALMAMIHVVDPAAETPDDKLRKVNTFIDYFKRRCLSLYQPRQKVAIDERMVKSRHSSGIRQYIKDKPTKWGIKLWVLADSSNGYTIDFNVYIGRAAGREVSANGLGYDVVMKLMNPFFNQGYHLYVDNFYTSVTLFKDLFARGVGATGTIIETRRDFPVNLKGGKQWAKGKDRGSMRWERDPPCLALQWLDNKVVSVITTIDKANVKDQVTRKQKTATGAWTSVEVPRPRAIANYNKFMNAVDRSDQILGTQNVLRKCIRWWKTLFFHLIDMAIVNSYILFREHQANFPDDPALHRTRDYSLAHFREDIVRELCGFPEYDHPPVHVTAKPAPDPGKYRTKHVPMVSQDRKTCVVCWQLTKKCFKVQTYCSAPTCNKFMHMTQDKNCFHIFHNTDEFRHDDDDE